MGNITQLDVGPNNLDFYIQIKDRHLGKVQVYKKIDKKLRYIVRYQVLHSNTLIYNKFQLIQKLQCSSLLRLYSFYVQKINCCNYLATEKVQSYWDYYNIYFDQYLKKRTKFNCIFMDTQFWHVVHICSEAYITFKKFEIIYQIDPRTFIVTPQGKMKTFWSHLKYQNQHLKFLQFFSSLGIFQTFYYSPEEIQCMAIKERSLKLNFDKCNSFRLGMLLLHCLTLTEPLQLCYNPSMTKINFNFIKKLIIQKVIPKYPEEIITLLKSLLQINPQNRPTLMEVYKKNIKKFSQQYQLKVCQSNEKMRKIQEQELAKAHMKRIKSFSDLFTNQNTEKTLTRQSSRV